MQVRLSFKRVCCNACSSCSSCASTVHRLAKLHICASRAGYAEPHMSVGRSPMPPPQAHQAQPGAVWTALILICATLTALAGAFTAFVMYMRPVLKVCCTLQLHCMQFYRERARLPWLYCNSKVVVGTLQKSTWHTWSLTAAGTSSVRSCAWLLQFTVLG